MKSFHASTDFFINKQNIHESVNHRNGKTLPVLQIGLNFEQEGRRALLFPVRWARMN